MKLTHENMEIDSLDSCVIDTVNSDIIYLNDTIRRIEDKFYKVFDLNPCPMAISKMDTDELVDVNESFIRILEIKSKYDVIGKITTENGINIIKKKDRNKILKILNNDNIDVKNVFIKFKNINGKNLKGLFTASIIELNSVKCLLTICQIINKKSIFNFISL